MVERYHPRRFESFTDDDGRRWWLGHWRRHGWKQQKQASKYQKKKSRALLLRFIINKGTRTSALYLLILLLPVRLINLEVARYWLLSKKCSRLSQSCYCLSIRYLVTAEHADLRRRDVILYSKSAKEKTLSPMARCSFVTSLVRRKFRRAFQRPLNFPLRFCLTDAP